MHGVEVDGTVKPFRPGLLHFLPPLCLGPLPTLGFLQDPIWPARKILHAEKNPPGCLRAAFP
jgi:hypothetical protein